LKMWKIKKISYQLGEMQVDRQLHKALLGIFSDSY